MRRLWLDNLRWTTVLLVLLYHVFFIFNNKGVTGGLGGFSDDPNAQPQDIVLYLLYPWFMMLLFLLAGMSARYSLEKRTAKEFIGSRFHKLIIPATVGPLFYHWITGYFIMMSSPVGEDFEQIPAVFKWLIFSTMGGGHMWFLQDLMSFSVLLLLVRLLDKGKRLLAWGSRATTPVLLLLAVPIYIGSQFMIYDPKIENPLDAMLNNFRPIAYFIPFLLGYYVFSHDSVLHKVKKMCIPVSICAAVAGIALCLTGWGESYISPEYLSSWLNCLYAWLMILAVMGIAMRWGNRTNRLCRYMTRASFGFYILHFAVVYASAFLLKNYTDLSPWLIYPLMLILVFGITPLIYEIIHRIPFVRWAVLGERKKQKIIDKR